MNIFEKKPINFINQYIEPLKWNKYRIIINGSASLKNINYYGDIDLFTSVKKTQNNVIYDKIKHIIERANKSKIYFLEQKIQYKDGTKIKGIYKMIPLKKYLDKEIDYIKLDFIIWFNDRFIELSIIYSFSGKNDKKDLQEMLNIISNEINEKLKKKDYFKSLKRIFNNIQLRHILGKKYYKKKLSALTALFNSEFGLMYQNTENLKAIQKMKKFKTFNIKKRLQLI